MFRHIPEAVQVYGGIVLAETISGIWPVVASFAIQDGFDPVAFVFYRSLGASMALCALAWFSEGRPPWSMLTRLGSNVPGAGKYSPWPEFVILGALMCAMMVSYTFGVAYTSSTQAALMQPVIPVMTCLAGLCLGTESVNTGKIIGIWISVIGAMYIVRVGEEEAEDHGKHAGRRYGLGALALVVNVTATAFYFVLQKAVLHRHTPIVVSSITMFIASCFLIVLTLLYAEEMKFPSWRPWLLTPRREAALAYAIIFTSTVQWVLLAWANKKTTPSTVTAFSTLQPLVAAITTAICLSVMPHGYTLMGGAAIIGGLLLTIRAQVSDSANPGQPTENSSLIRVAGRSDP